MSRGSPPAVYSHWVTAPRLRRTVVVGCGGSGKTTFARRLGALLGSPVVHLDVVYRDSGRRPLPGDRFAALQRELVASPRWVIEGDHTSTLPIRLRRADTVVFLDLPPAVCLWGITRRLLGGAVRGRAGRRAQRAGVDDRITWEFLRYVWSYRRRTAPRVRELIAEHAGDAQVHVVPSRRAADALLARLPVTPASRTP
ncbi:topology modulation protein [Actinomadura scrupuli]|uniref:topology modulation protein n=1 Tax=Actinomadura scrupuli TaxID=559629 RepID=UPI003D9A048C